jgi:hypothetical protein
MQNKKPITIMQLEKHATKKKQVIYCLMQSASIT